MPPPPPPELMKGRRGKAASPAGGLPPPPPPELMKGRRGKAAPPPPELMKGRRGKAASPAGGLPPPPPPELMMNGLLPPTVPPPSRGVAAMSGALPIPREAAVDPGAIPLPSGTPPKMVAIEEEVMVDVDVMDDIMDSLDDRRSVPDDMNYRQLWQRQSRKPLQQVYGHIDRLASGEVGSLLDRYADRFGHQLDRELIVKRRREREDALAKLREAPVVELIEDDDEHEEAETSAAAEPSVSVAEPIAPLEPWIEDALEDAFAMYTGKTVKVREKIELAAKRGQQSQVSKLESRIGFELDAMDAIEAVLEGEESVEAIFPFVPAVAGALAPEPESMPEPRATPTPSGAIPDDEDEAFAAYIGFVDAALGALPEEDVEAFTATPEFELYRTVAMAAGESTTAQRHDFALLVDRMLGDLPEAEVERLLESPDFSLYTTVTQRYQ